MQKPPDKTQAIVGIVAVVLALGITGGIAWALNYAGFFSRPQTQSAQQASPGNLDEFRRAIAQIDPSNTIVANIAAGTGSNEAVITVSNAWHSQPYQIRLQTAQNLWKAWSSIASPSEPDKARIKLVDLNGNTVGGSGIAGSLVDVSKP